MSDTVDLLHAAEDEIGRLRLIIDEIWWRMVDPTVDSSSDTFDNIGFYLESNGWQGLHRLYPGLSESLADRMDELDLNAVADRWPRLWAKIMATCTPPRYARFDCVCQTGDADDCDPVCCGCPCGHAEANG